MAKNNMTPEQDLAVRDFYSLVLSDESLFPGDPVGRRQALVLCRRLLNYVIVDGKHVALDKVEGSTYTLHSKAEYLDEWEEDTRRAMDEANQDKTADEADSSEQTTDTEVREAVLPKDV